MLISRFDCLLLVFIRRCGRLITRHYKYHDGRLWLVEHDPQYSSLFLCVISCPLASTLSPVRPVTHLTADHRRLGGHTLKFHGTLGLPQLIYSVSTILRVAMNGVWPTMKWNMALLVYSFTRASECLMSWIIEAVSSSSQSQTFILFLSASNLSSFLHV